jgi:hypothetical protein
MADFVTSLIVVFGPGEARQRFADAHLANNTFDFNSVRPMPEELNIESSSAVETGYAALYGDWASVSGYWMFKEPAQEFGFPFPLASREQVIQSLKSFDCAEMYLAPAMAYYENVKRYGHGDWYGWCVEHWGTKWNASDALVRIEAQQIQVSFVTAGSYPKPILKDLSATFPELEFHVRYVDEHGRRARDFVLLKGKETKKLKRPVQEIAAEVEDFVRGET